jgi:hypothetical protein
MPESFTPDVKDLVSKMLELDPCRRITIEQLKAHPAFLANLPRDYTLPRPLPVPTGGELDQSAIPSDLIDILRGIGYDSDDEIVAELLSEERTNAKIFYEMYSERITGDSFVDMLPWDGMAQVSPDEPLTQSPQVFPEAGSVNAADAFARRRKMPDIQSPDVRSLASKVDYWGGIQEEDRGATLTEIATELPVLMAAMQLFLSGSQFAWYHQSDLEFLARAKRVDLVVKIQVRYIREDLLEMSVAQKRGNAEVFGEFVAELTEFLKDQQPAPGA